MVEPEILDDLPMDDPEAVASRVDLRRINFLMGNERWIRRQMPLLRDRTRKGIVEWGAGTGDLLQALARFGPVTGVDRVGRPAGLPDGMEWRQADVFDEPVEGGVLVTNLFLHHFEGEALRRLGERMSAFSAVVVVEPWRAPLALTLGGIMQPFVSRVTRHDMPVSIRAGFRRGELAEALGLDRNLWDISESVDLRGGLRWRALRRDDPGGATAGGC